MGVMAGRAFHLKALAGVVQADLIGIGVAVGIIVEKSNVFVYSGGRVEVHTRQDSILTLDGKTDADRMIVCEIGTNVEYGEIGCATDHTVRGVTCQTAPASCSITHNTISAVKSLVARRIHPTCRIVPGIEKGGVLAGLLAREVSATTRHVDNGVNGHSAVVTGQTGQRIRPRLAHWLGNGGRVVSVVSSGFVGAVPQRQGYGGVGTVRGVAIDADFTVVVTRKVHYIASTCTEGALT